MWLAAELCVHDRGAGKSETLAGSGKKKKAKGAAVAARGPQSSKKVGPAKQKIISFNAEPMECAALVMKGKKTALGKSNSGWGGGDEQSDRRLGQKIGVKGGSLGGLSAFRGRTLSRASKPWNMRPYKKQLKTGKKSKHT